MAQPGWTEHANEIVSIVSWVGGSLIATILVMGGASIKVALYLGRLFVAELAAMKGKIDTMHDAMLGCDGCRESLERRDRRSTDRM